MQLHAFLIEVVASGWVADFVPSAGGFFLRFKDNRQIRCVAQSAETSKERRAAFKPWKPTDEDPMVVKMRSMQKAEKVGSIS